MGHVDGGYFLNISVVPKQNGGINDTFRNKITAQVKTEFKSLLHAMAPRNMDRPSMQKASFYDLSRFNVLDGDQGFDLMLLQKSINIEIMHLDPGYIGSHS